MRRSLNLPRKVSQHPLPDYCPAMHSRLAIARPRIAATDVVHTDPDREQRVLARPRGVLGLLTRALEEVVHLPDERARGARASR